MKSSLEIGAGRFRDAEQTIALMRGLPDNTGVAARKQAIMLCKQSADASEALAVISEAINNSQNSRRAMADLHATRCIIAAKLFLVERAREDMAVAKANHRHSDFIGERLAIHVLMAEGKNQDAIKAYENLKQTTRLDRSLKKEILRRLVEDQHTFEKDRKIYMAQLRDSATERNSFTEFDF